MYIKNLTHFNMKISKVIKYKEEVICSILYSASHKFSKFYINNERKSIHIQVYLNAD